jgi:toxin secretion/phage lysis holin
MFSKFDLGVIVKLVVAGCGSCISYLFGGWSQLLQALLFFVIADYITGMIAGGIEGKLSSSIGMKGIAKKVFIFLIVAIAHLIDKTLGDSNIFRIRDAAIYFYLANELLSIIENAGRAGISFPDGIKQAVKILRGKSGLDG